MSIIDTSDFLANITNDIIGLLTHIDSFGRQAWIGTNGTQAPVTSSQVSIPLQASLIVTDDRATWIHTSLVVKLHVSMPLHAPLSSQWCIAHTRHTNIIGITIRGIITTITVLDTSHFLTFITRIFSDCDTDVESIGRQTWVFTINTFTGIVVTSLNAIACITITTHNGVPSSHSLFALQVSSPLQGAPSSQ